MHATYLIPVENGTKLVAKLEKLSKKAVQLGCAAIFCALVKTFSRPHPDKARAADGEKVVYEAYEIRGEAPSLNGWVFAATLDHYTNKDGEPRNILRSHGEESLPVRFRTATPDQCDHCGTNRRRKNTFVVRHEESGEWLQVGRQCLKDFLGYHKDPGAIARYAALLLTLDSVIGEYGEGGEGGGGEYLLDLNTFLAYTVQAIDDTGWTSRTVAREHETLATADCVFAYMTAETESARNAYRIPAPTEATYREVKEALAWLAEQDPVANDYVHNCQVIADIEAVSWRSAGYAASIISSHRRAKERNLRAQVLKAEGTDHVGTLGKREEFLLTLLGIVEIDGYYGTSYLHRMSDQYGNQVIWFASNPDIVDGERMATGATYRVKATVKSHDSYKGQAQTKVTRLAVQPLCKVKKARKRRVKKAEKGAA